MSSNQAIFAIITIMIIAFSLQINARLAYSYHDIDEESYIIFTDGVMVFALNADTEVIDFEGSDAGSVINSAINAIESGTIKIDEGSYFVSSTIRPNSKIQLIGNGPNTVLRPTQNQSLILNAHPNDPSLGIKDHEIVLGNFSIDYTGHKGDVINLVSVEKAYLFQIIIANSTGTGDALDFDGCKEITVKSAKFYNIGGSAVHVSDAFTDWTTFKGSSNVKVIDAYASNVGKIRHVAAFNVFARETAIAESNNNSFENISVENSYAGVAFSGLGSENKLKRAVINGTDYRGVYTSGTKNLIEDVEVYGAGSHGIIINKSKDSKVEDVTVQSSKYNNIAIVKSDKIDIKNANLGSTGASVYSNMLLDFTFHSTIEDVTLLNNAQLPRYNIEELPTSDYNTFIVDETMVSIKVSGPNSIVSDESDD